jgi:hypothetical protein
MAQPLNIPALVLNLCNLCNLWIFLIVDLALVLTLDSIDLCNSLFMPVFGDFG